MGVSDEEEKGGMDLGGVNIREKGDGSEQQKNRKRRKGRRAKKAKIEA